MSSGLWWKLVTFVSRPSRAVFVDFETRSSSFDMSCSLSTSRRCLSPCSVASSRNLGLFSCDALVTSQSYLLRPPSSTNRCRLPAPAAAVSHWCTSPKLLPLVLRHDQENRGPAIAKPPRITRARKASKNLPGIARVGLGLDEECPALRLRSNFLLSWSCTQPTRKGRWIMDQNKMAPRGGLTANLPHPHTSLPRLLAASRRLRRCQAVLRRKTLSK
ncbi:hypothetical protein OF83DRAFT_898003 [Amylostereum chailletii]|nr:hypothetical protein OF83DRAFT_898003 [Amylostereum chailletii]